MEDGFTTIKRWMEKTACMKASDLHLCADREPMIRKDGVLMPIDETRVDGQQLVEMVASLSASSRMDEFYNTGSVDFSFELTPTGRFRGSLFNQHHGISAVLRVIPSHPPLLDSLSAPAILSRLTQSRSGLVLVTGSTGSGKSTTLAAMVDLINRSCHSHILTLEDPIEFVHRPIQSAITQREITTHVVTFQDGLRSSLRQDPDVILVGEMRDMETIRLALTAAETGHLVMASLHTTTAPGAVNRIIDVFSGHQQPMIRSLLAQSLRAVISQTLLPAVNGGRVAAWEVMMGTPAVQNLIREDKIAQIHSIMQSGSSHHMNTMEQSVSTLVNKGVISQETAQPYQSGLGLSGNLTGKH